MLQFLGCLSEEGAAGAGEDQALHLSPVPVALQRLEQGGVLGIHGEDLCAEVVGLLHHQLAAAYQGLLVGQGDALALPDGGHGGPQTHHTHHSGEHRVCAGQGGGLHQAVHPRQHLYRGVSQAHLQVGGGLLVHEHRQLRVIAPGLLLQPVHAGVGRDGSHLHAAGVDNVQGLPPDGAGGP